MGMVVFHPPLWLRGLTGRKMREGRAGGRKEADKDKFAAAMRKELGVEAGDPAILAIMEAGEPPGLARE